MNFKKKEPLLSQLIIILCISHMQQRLSHSMWPQIYVRPPKVMLHTSICYPDSLIKAIETIKLGLWTCKIMHFIKFGVGNVVMVIGEGKGDVLE